MVVVLPTPLTPTTRTTAGRSVRRSVVSNFAKCSSSVSFSIRCRSRGSVVRKRSTFSRSSSTMRSVMSGPKSAVNSAVSRSSHVVSSMVGLTNMPRSARPSDQELCAMLPAYWGRPPAPGRSAGDALGDALADHGRHAVLSHRHAVEGVRDLHRALLMGDHDELARGAQLLEDPEQTPQVGVVQRGLHLVQDVEGARPR